MNLEPLINPKSRAHLRLAGVVLAALFACATYCGAQTNANTGPTMDSFKIIRQRNIFDPNRTSRLRLDPRPGTRRQVIDTFALVGTMSYSKGQFAFFDGSGSQFKKVLEPGGNIAGYTVKEVTPNAVTLAANGKEFEVKVGAQLRNEGSSGWRLSTETEQSASADSAGDTNDSSSPSLESTAPPVGASPDASAALKRLMEMRQKELQ